MAPRNSFHQSTVNLSAMNTRKLNETFMPVEEKNPGWSRTRIQRCSEMHHKQKELISYFSSEMALYITLKSLKSAVSELIFSESALFSAEKNQFLHGKTMLKSADSELIFLISADSEEVSSETHIFGIGQRWKLDCLKFNALRLDMIMTCLQTLFPKWI